MEDAESVDDNLGIDDPIAFSEDEDDDAPCALCAHGSDAPGDPLTTLAQMDHDLCHAVTEDQLRAMQSEVYETQVARPHRDRGLKAPEVTPSALKRHFHAHALNLKRAVVDDIRLCNMAQQHLRRRGLRVRNSATGETRVVGNELRSWLSLSKHKLDLIKYYRAHFDDDKPAKRPRIHMQALDFK